VTDDILKAIGNLAVNIRERLDGEVDSDLLDLFTMVGKYMTLAFLPKELRARAGSVTISAYCPLCQARLDPSRTVQCGDCVLKGTTPGNCGPDYESLRGALLYGTPIDVAFHLKGSASRLARRIVDEWKSTETEDA